MSAPRSNRALASVFRPRRLLVARTDPEIPKHKGLTYMLIDMHSPGISVRPLKQMTGDSEFNEVSFQNVRVPVENVVGKINGGWEIAIATLVISGLAGIGPRGPPLAGTARRHAGAGPGQRSEASDRRTQLSRRGSRRSSRFER